MKRTRAAALAFAMACGAVGLAGPAAAETTYMSLAFAPTNRIVGEGTSTVSAEDAQGQAVASCQSRGGSDCRWATWNTAPGCVALVAASDGDRWAGGFGSTTDEAVAGAFRWGEEQGLPLPPGSPAVRTFCAG